MKLKNPLLEDLYSPGRWCLFPYIFLAVMSPREAILMAYLININSMEEAKDNYDGWFVCKQDRIANALLIKKDNITKLFRSLKNKGFLETSWSKTLPPKLLIQVNMKSIHAKVTSLDGCDIDNLPNTLELAGNG